MSPRVSVKILALSVFALVLVYSIAYLMLVDRPNFARIAVVSQNASRASVSAQSRAPPLILFLVMPSLLGPEDHATQLARSDAVRHTWASQLPLRRTFFVQWFATHTPIFDIPGQLLIVPKEHNATYATRVLWAMRTLIEHHNPDWIVKGDDVTYFLVPNMLRLLSSRDSDEPHFLGHRLRGPGMPRPFVSAGAGYALSRPLLQTLMQALKLNHPCLQNGGAEDITVAHCIDALAGMQAEASVDEDGREFFHAFSPPTLLGIDGGVYRFPVDWYSSYREPFGGVRVGNDCCSRRSVSFHYVLPQEMMAMHATLQDHRYSERLFGAFIPPAHRVALEQFLVRHIQV
jgi:hypothetical protein